MQTINNFPADISRQRSGKIPLVVLALSAAGAFLATVCTSQLKDSQDKLASNLSQCVSAELPNVKHRINRDSDRVLILDKKGKTIGRIGLSPAVGDDRLTPPLKPAADAIRSRCKGAVAAVVT